MKTKLLGTAVALGLAATPFMSHAGGVGGGNANSNWTIYGWQYGAYEIIDNDGERDSRDRLTGNASNIGFAASIDTGVSVAGTPVKANLQCETFTHWNNLNGHDWCLRNSKLGLAGPWGEIMFATWLTPDNEAQAQWVDPFYDASALTYSTIIGTYGLASHYYNGGTFNMGDGDFNYQGEYDLSFLRRQENMIQWFSPNWGGLTMRAAVTAGNRDDTAVEIGDNDLGGIDPRILMGSIAWERNLANGGNVWLSAVIQDRTDWGAAAMNNGSFFTFDGDTADTFGCDDSDESAWRLAARYIHDWGNGMSTSIAGLYEEIDMEIDCFDEDGEAVLAHKVQDLERDAWLISLKHKFGGPWDFRFTYMSADDYDCGSGAPEGESGGSAFVQCFDSSSGADAMNVGIHYTMPAGTELMLNYGTVDNDSNGTYDFGINGAGIEAAGDDPEVWQIGMVQWF